MFRLDINERVRNRMQEHLFRSYSTTIPEPVSVKSEDILARINKAMDLLKLQQSVDVACVTPPFGGITIIESQHCLKEADTPIRNHERKPWMRDSYHNRIRKKWIKRWGYEKHPVMYNTPQGIICHPSIAQRLREQISSI